MDKRQIAAQIFLDAINGDNVTTEQAKQIAIGAWEAAAIFDACEPKTKSENMIGSYDGKTKGCKACFGSGGKVNAPCKVCHGTGKVPV